MRVARCLLSRSRVADRVSIAEGGSEIVDDFASLTDLVFSTDEDSRKPTSASVRAMLATDHPQRKRCSLRLFHVPGRARVAAIVNPRLKDDRGAPIGLLGFFEAVDDPIAARAVLDAGAQWLRERGATIVRGPVNFSTWNDYRLAVPSDNGWFRGEPYHPNYYLRLWEDAGFDVCSRYGSYWLDSNEDVLAKFLPTVERGVEQGYAVRPISVGDLPVLYQLALAGFSKAYLYSPIEPDEFASIYSADRAADASATSFVATLEDRPIGFVYTFVADLPDGPAGIIKTIVVSPEIRGGVAYGTLMSAAIDAFVARGVTRVMGGLMHADGSPASMGWCRPEKSFKQYVLLQQR